MHGIRLLVVLVTLIAARVCGAEVPTFVHEGRAYVELSRVAESVDSRLEGTADSPQAFLRTPGHVVTVTRNWARVTVNGTPIVLDAPVRVDKDGRWIAPRTFLTDVLPRIVPAAAAAPAPAAPPAVVSAARVATALPPAAIAPRAATPPPAAPPAPVVAPRVAALPPPTPPPPPRVAPPPPAVAPALPPAPRVATPPAPAAPPAPAPPRVAPPPPGATLEELRYRSYPAFTRIVLETSAPISHRVEVSGTKEARVRLLAVTGPEQAHEISDGYVNVARLERAGSDTLLRVALDDVPGDVKVSALADPPRLLLDFARPAVVAPRESRAAIPPLRVVVLDAGHGGHDSGAVGPGGLQEKELVLDVTRRVAKLVTERLGVKVVLSRDGDHFVPLRDRTTLANKAGADLFVSIHANAHRHAASRGVETYFLSSEATDSAARQVAAAENGVIQLENPAAGARNDVVKTILWDLAQSEFQSESSRLAEIVQDSMTQTLRIPNRGVKQAGFYVLGGAAMPAILVEIGFVSNPREERRLKDRKYRDEIAKAIFAGIAEYKRQSDVRAGAENPAPVRVGQER
ncbi:MAG: N-acetylmuramoyl-L-alanine amidase [Candidatus Rokuibacteriota bacterium]